MSIEAREWVTNVAPPTATDRDRVVLDILADMANKEGRNVFPSRETIAWKAWRDTSDAGVRKASRALAALKKGGWITVDQRCPSELYWTIPANRRPVAYRLDLTLTHTARPVTSDTSKRGDTSDTAQRRGDTHGRVGVSPVTDRGVTGDRQSGREPGENREGERGDVGDTLHGPQDSPAPSPKSLDELAALHAAGAPGTGRDSDRCPAHAHIAPGEPVPPCVACREVRLTNEASASERERLERAEHLARRARLKECPFCDDFGWTLDPATGDTIDPAEKCSHPPIALEA